MKNVIAAIMLTTLAACGDDVLAPRDSQSRFGELTLSYGPCFGSCPVFSVTLNESGSLVFEGERFTEALGRHRRQMSSSLFEDIVSELDSLPDSELVDPLVCPRIRTDHSSVSGTLRTGRHDLEIKHYYGCGGYEYRRRQVQLIRKITDMLQVDDLVGWDPNRPTR